MKPWETGRLTVDELNEYLRFHGEYVREMNRQTAELERARGGR